MHVDKAHEVAIWSTWLSKLVRKDKKPFKSKLKVNTVAGFMQHPVTHHMCFTFVEDDSYVECFRTFLVTGKPSWTEAPPEALAVAVKRFGAGVYAFSEWCWVTSTASVTSVTSWETRPIEFLDSACDRVKAFIKSNTDRVAAGKEGYRQRQSARDKAIFLLTQQTKD